MGEVVSSPMIISFFKNGIPEMTFEIFSSSMSGRFKT